MANEKLINDISKRLNWQDEIVGDALENVIKIIEAKIADGEVVSFGKLGTFESEMKSEHVFVDTATGDSFLVPPKIDVTFKPSESLKDKFKDFKNEDNEQ